MCRACLSTENPMIPVDELFIKGYNLLTQLNVSLVSGLFIFYNNFVINRPITRLFLTDYVD